MPGETFRERLTVPVWWWLVAGVFVVSIFVAAAFSLGPLPGAALTLVAVIVVVAVLHPYGSAQIIVDQDGLQAGDARIGWAWLSGVRPLDPEATTRRLRTEADARAHLVVRPYLTEAVEVAVADPADPHPYWLVSTRHPERLAAAIASGLDTQR